MAYRFGPDTQVITNVSPVFLDLINLMGQVFPKSAGGDSPYGAQGIWFNSRYLGLCSVYVSPLAALFVVAQGL